MKWIKAIIRLPFAVINLLIIILLIAVAYCIGYFGQATSMGYKMGRDSAIGIINDTFNRVFLKTKG